MDEPYNPWIEIPLLIIGFALLPITVPYILFGIVTGLLRDQ
jgi:hypothetical protein